MKDNKQKQLFTELTPEEGAAVSGGTKTYSSGGGFVNIGQIDQGNGNDSINVGSTPPPFLVAAS